MKKLYIMRHGETEWNIQKRYQGQMDSGLTETGRIRTALQKEKIRDIKFSSVYCSPLGRTRSTLEILTPTADRVIFDDRLKEICLGGLQGKTHDELTSHEAEQHHKLWHDPASFRMHGAETMTELETRIREFLKDLQRLEDDILVITHTIIIKMIIKVLESKAIEHLWDDPHLYPAVILVIDMNKQPCIQRVINPEEEMGLPVCYTA